MTTQVFNVRPVGNCLQLVPVPTPSTCTEQSEICIQQLQNFLNAVRPVDNGGCISSLPDFDVIVVAGDLDVEDVFLNPALDYRTQFILTGFNTTALTSPANAIFNLSQVGIIVRPIVSDPIVLTITDPELTCIINSIPSTFNRCQNSNSFSAQQIEAAATALISTTSSVTIASENTGNLSDLFIRAVKPGIIIATSPGTAPYEFVAAFSTCFVSSIRPTPTSPPIP